MRLNGQIMQTPFDEYFYPIFAVGVLLATVVSLYAGSARGWLLPLLCLIVGVISFWGSLFIGLEVGYQMWQASPDPPDEAFSDTSPIGALLAGWVPASLYCGLLYGVVKFILFLIPKREPSDSQKTAASERIESGNPFQGP
jgi:hypothetical protein